MSKLGHLFIPGASSLCWWCGESRSQHPTVVHHEPTVRRPSQLDRVKGGTLPRFEVQP
jgi:hypothetical protein